MTLTQFQPVKGRKWCKASVSHWNHCLSIKGGLLSSAWQFRRAINSLHHFTPKRITPLNASNWLNPYQTALSQIRGLWQRLGRRKPEPRLGIYIFSGHLWAIDDDTRGRP